MAAILTTLIHLQVRYLDLIYCLYILRLQKVFILFFLDEWGEFMKTNKGYIEKLDQYGIDPSKMPKQNAALGAATNTTELSGTFKKLNVD